MDVTQLLLTIVIIVLTILLAVIGTQVVLILMEVRFAMQKMNQMLEHAQSVTGGISRSFTGMTGLIKGLKTGLSLVHKLGKKRQTDND